MILLHGDYQLGSRQRLNQLTTEAKNSNKEVVWLNGLQMDPTQLTQTLESFSLFNQERLTVVENFFFRPKSQLKQTLMGILKANSESQVIFWEKKAIDGRQLRALKFIQVELFKTPQVIFKFLDNFRPNNLQTILGLFHQAIIKHPAELIFYLLAGRIRQLLIAQTAPKELKGAPWQRAQWHKQAQAFSREQLEKLYHQFLEIDIAIKTGQSVWRLEDQLDLLLIDL
ncbi:hypothetical protein KKD62_03920 [Patescibacteria group bacterium]|nr:hypothetical protein [Patescibacteria group bacterium]MBU1931896.1 hypothetical protein [Patescibacteria group bacterium]